MSLGALAGSQSLGVGPYQEGKSAGFLQLPCLQGHQTAGRPRLGIGKTEDLGLRREKREQPCSRWVPSGSRQWNISPLIIISKREERRWVSWLSLFNYFFPLGRQSHNEGEAGQGPDKGGRCSAKAVQGQWGWPATCWPLLEAGIGICRGRIRRILRCQHSLGESWECN